MGTQDIDEKVIKEGQEQLDRICKTEYGINLIQLLNQGDKGLTAARLSRLGGVILKKDFANSESIKPENSKSTIDTFTKAKNSYAWDRKKLEDPGKQVGPEFELLDQLRKSMPELLQRKPTWEELLGQADHERGLFKVLALFVWDYIKDRETKSIREYYEQKESIEFKTALNITTAVFGYAMTPVYASILPVPGLVVVFSLMGIEFGYDKLYRTKELGDRSVDEHMLQLLTDDENTY